MQLLLTRPAKFVKSRLVVERPDGSQVGEIVQQNVFGKINFSMEAGGRQVGMLKAENWRAWNFSIVDSNETEVARITKKWAGFAKAAFTTADKYVLEIHRPLEEPLRSLVVSTALAVDTALKQDAGGGLRRPIASVCTPGLGRVTSSPRNHQRVGDRSGEGSDPPRRHC